MPYQLADSLVLVNSVLTCLLSTLTFSLSDSPFCSSNICICISAFKPDTFKAQYLCYHILCILHLAAFARQQAKKLNGGLELELFGTFTQHNHLNGELVVGGA